MTTLSHRDCFETLGLATSADREAVRGAFHRLAKLHHPDLRKAGGDRATFLKVVQAYMTLQRAFREGEALWTQRRCGSCGKEAELFEGLDGAAQCEACLLGVSRRGRFLPLPLSIRTVRHAAVIGLEGVSVYLLIAGVTTDTPMYFGISMLAGFTAIGLLAVTCLKVRHT
jgi:hypothetical protein